MINKCSDPTCSICGDGLDGNDPEREIRTMINKNPYGTPKAGPNTVETSERLSGKARAAMIIFGLGIFAAGVFILALLAYPYGWLAGLHGQSGYLVWLRFIVDIGLVLAIAYAGIGACRLGLLTVADALSHR